MSGEWKKTTCAFCSVCCGLELKVENNHIVDVRPDPDNKSLRTIAAEREDPLSIIRKTLTGCAIR